MKAIILAAGLGRRLRPYTDRLPKCLIKINGTTVIERQIKILNKCGISNIVVVCGHFAYKVRRQCQKMKGVKYLFNPFYASTNSIITLWFTRRCWDEDLLIMNSDLLFDEVLIQRMIDTPHDLAVLVNRIKEGYRVRLKKGYVSDMKMDISDRMTYGAYCGITKIRKNQFRSFNNMLESWVVKGHHQNWYEDVVVGMIKQGTKVVPVLTDTCFWHELDTPEDLKRARHILKK